MSRRKEHKMKLKELKQHIATTVNVTITYRMKIVFEGNVKRIPDTLDNLTVGLILPKVNATTDFNISVNEK